MPSILYDYKEQLLSAQPCMRPPYQLVNIVRLWFFAGLIGWVPNTDTLHALIREYRDARKIPLNVEHRLMLGMAPDYENLTVIQKVEVFEHALESTSGMTPHLLCHRLDAPGENELLYLLLPLGYAQHHGAITPL